jgi:hypothetical protein
VKALSGRTEWPGCCCNQWMNAYSSEALASFRPVLW